PETIRSCASVNCDEDEVSERTRLHHAKALTVLDDSRTLPQGDRRARPAFAGGAVGRERNLVVLHAGDVCSTMLSPSGLQVSPRKVKCVRVVIALSSSSRPRCGGGGVCCYHFFSPLPSDRAARER